MPAPPCLFSPKQVAEALQVSESSVKRWCDQGLISTIRTCGGHRRIPLDRLLQFLNQSERPLLNPMAIGLEAPPRRRSEPRCTPGSKEQAAFHEALASGDEPRCRQIVDQVHEQTASATQTAEHLIADAMHRLGEAWDCSQLDVYQERRACNICMRLIEELRRRFSASAGPVAIGGSPAGDPYQLPTALVELALREAGWSADSIGANLPFDSLSRAVEDYRPRLLWISASVIPDGELFTERFNRMARRLPDDCVLLVGGRALTDAIRPRLKYTAHCDSLGQLLELAEAMRRRAVDVPQSHN